MSPATFKGVTGAPIVEPWRSEPELDEAAPEPERDLWLGLEKPAQDVGEAVAGDDGEAAVPQPRGVDLSSLLINPGSEAQECASWSRVAPKQGLDLSDLLHAR